MIIQQLSLCKLLKEDFPIVSWKSDEILKYEAVYMQY